MTSTKDLRTCLRVLSQGGDLRTREYLCWQIVELVRHDIYTRLQSGRITQDDLHDGLLTLFRVVLRKASSGQIDLSRTDAELRAYFRRIALNAIRTARAKRYRSGQAMPRGLMANLSSNVESGDAAAIAELNAAVSRLPASDRQLVSLLYDRGLSTRQAAARLGQSQSTVVRRVRRIVLRLQSELAR